MIGNPILHPALDGPFQAETALKASNAIWRLRPLITDCRSGAMPAAGGARNDPTLGVGEPRTGPDAPHFHVPSTGGVNASASGCLPPAQEVPHPLSRHNSRGRRGPHPVHAGTVRTRLADVPGSSEVQVSSPLARLERCLVHPPSRGGRLARATQPCEPRRHADHLRDVVVCRRPRRPGGLVRAGAGVSGVPDLAARRRVVAGVDDGWSLRSPLKGSRERRAVADLGATGSGPSACTTITYRLKETR